MSPVIVLVHSPSVGPSTWAPVAERLTRVGWDCLLPSLLDVAESQPPFWRRVAGDVEDALAELPPARQVAFVVHSNAGLYVPLLVEHSRNPVAACVFVDAVLPAQNAATAAAPAEMQVFLRSMLDDDGRLPRWTDWWDEADIAPLFPDEATRAAVSAEAPRLPYSYFEQEVPVPAGWDERVPCGYLWFVEPYDEFAAQAGERGWPVRRIAGQHLHQLVDPAAVADAVAEMVASLSRPGERPAEGPGERPG